MKKAIKGAMAIAVIVMAASCKSGENKNEVVVTDTTTSANVTDNMTVTNTAADSNTAMANTTMTDTAATAKPNPAKKGKKGSVTATLPTKKSSGNMEEMDKEGYYTNVSPAFPG